MRKVILSKNVLVLLILLTFSAALNAATIVQTQGDNGLAMGSLIDIDEDGSSSIASTSSLYIGSTYAGITYQDHYSSAFRRAVTEIPLASIKDISTNSVDIVASTLNFYFDDVIFASKMPDPVTSQNFTLEIYTSTANGIIDAADGDDTNASIGATGIDDWGSTGIASYTFTASSDATYSTSGGVMGVYGPDEYYPAGMGDAELMLYGNIGFEVDVTDIISSLVGDNSVDYIGFRWLQIEPGGYWTSMDGANYLPTLTTQVVPEPATMAFILGGSIALLRRKR